MNGFMNIRIQVLANQARKAIQNVDRDLSRLSIAQGAGAAASGRHDGAMRKQMRSLTSFGNQLQWTGRQLQYNWTLPVLAAAAAGVHFQMENEKAMTRLKKVYADPGFEHTATELKALEGAFESLSAKYGVAQAEVVGIAADWAAAGSSGLALAQQVEQTMKTMVLGELKAADATEALIAIQAQYGFNTAQLTETIAQLNNVENQTGTTMGDLITSMSKSAGVARAAGIDVAHLAAMTAALVPAAGTAAQAGNGLKTMISRLMSPTFDATQVLEEMGIAVDDMSWKGANASVRLQTLAEEYMKLSDSQKAVVSSTIASRYQVNKAEVLFEDMANKVDENGEALGYYDKALAAATNRTQYLDQVTRELNAVLSSNPKKWDKIKAVMSNSLANVVQPMLPALMAIGGKIAMLTERLSEMSPVTLKWIGVGLAMLVLLPMMVRYIGSLITLFATFGRALIFLLAPLGLLIRGLRLLALTSVVTTMVGWLGTALMALGRAAWVGLTALAGLTRWIAVMPAALNLLVSASIFAASMIATPLAGIWAAVSASWLVGLTGLSATLLAAFAMIGAAVPLSVMSGMSGGLAALLGLWRTFTTAMATVFAFLGPTLSRTWIMVSVSLSVIMAQTSAGLLIIWRSLMLALETALIGFAAAAGVIWRTIPLIMAAGIRGPWAFILGLTANFMVAMQTIFAAGWAAIQHIIVAGAAAAGIVWRNAMVMLTLITAAGGAAMNLVWLAITKMWAMRTAMITAITFLWGNVIVPVMATIGRALLAALASPWTWAALAVVAILYGLRDKIVVAWNSIVDWVSGAAEAVVDRVVGAFNLLPRGIQNAILAVVRIVRDAALQVYEWFSYLNPFAHHSPSLVENVTRGMAAVNAQFGTLSQIKGPIDNAYASIARFKTAMGALGDNLEFSKDRELVAEISPGALASFDNLTHTLVGIRAQADQLQAAVKQQENVVKVWQQRLDVANESLEDQRDILDRLQDVADGYGDQISKLNEEIDTLASTPLSGMGAMEDALFANEMAQKSLRLEMLKAGEEGGQSIDDIRNKIASMAGEMETLIGERENMRSMGAGSEILGMYDAQLAALDSQKQALEDATAPVNEMQQQLDELQRQAEIMDLEKALAFDPLTRQIDKAANAMAEMPFDQIIGKIRTNQSAVEQLEHAHAGATAAVEAQEAAVTRAQAAVDAIQASYDAEADKLEVLRDLYQEVADAVRDMEGALSDASGAANAVKQAKESEGYVSPALQNFRDAAGGNFADVGGKGMIGREGGDIDQSAMIDEFTGNLAEEAGKMFGEFDMFQPLREMWDKFVAWWNRVIGPWITAAGDFFGHIFDGVDIFGGLEGKADEIGGFFTRAWDVISNVLSTVWDFGKMLWEILGPDIITTLDTVFGFFVDMWDNLKTIWADASEMVEPLMDALTNLWNIVKVPIGLIFGAIVTGVQIAWSVFNGVLGPVLDWVSGLFMNLWQVVKGVIDMFIGLFTLDFDRFFSGLGDAIEGLWGIVWDTLVSLGDLILSALGGLVSGIWDAMFYIGEMIWDGLDAGLNAIGLGWLTDIIGGLIDFVKDLFGINSPSTVFAEIGGFLMDGLLRGIELAFGAVNDFFLGLPGMILDALGDAGTWLLEQGQEALEGFLNGMKAAWEAIVTWFDERKEDIEKWLTEPWSAGEVAMASFASVVSIVLIPALVKAAIQAGITAATIIGSWIAMGIQQAISVAETVILMALYVAQWVMASAAATWNAIKIAAAWVVTQLGAYKAIAVMIAQAFIYVGRWLWMAGMAAIHAAQIVIAWLVTQAGAVAAILVMIAQAAIFVAKWVWMGTQALINAARIAAAWLIAMGPVGWIILAVLALIGVIWYFWDEIEAGLAWLGDKWNEFAELVTGIWDEFTLWLAEQWYETGGKLITEIDEKLTWLGEQWDNFKVWVSEIWTEFTDWLGEKWDATGGKLFTAIGEALDTLGLKWEEFKTWISGVWNGFWDGVQEKARGAVDWVQEKFEGFKNKIGEIFQSIRDKVGEIWDGLIEKVKTPIRVVFSWVNGNMIDPINSLLKKFPGDLQIPPLPALREGGQVRGPGTSTSDSILGVNRKGVPTALVSDGEFVVNAKSTRENFGLLQALNSGNLPRFRDGGPLGNIGQGASWLWDKASNAASWVGDKLGDLIAAGGRLAAEHILKPLANTVKGFIPGDGIFPTTLRGSIDKLYEAVAGKGDEHDKQQATLQGGTFPGTGKRTPNGIGGLGPQALAARNFVMQTFGISNIGGYANRNIAGTGTKSDHATGHALDVMIANYKTPAGIAKGNRVASYFVQNPSRFGTKYVIWRDQINQGLGWEAYGHPGGGRSDTLQHRDHVHLSLFDEGGIMKGLGVNLTGRPERVLSPRQTVAFDRLVAALDRDGIPSVERMEAAIFRATAKANAANAIGSQTVIQNQGDTNVTVNIYGDLSFPNITDGDDADVFLQNLGDLAGGGRR